MRFFNFFLAYMVQKYQNESPPIFYNGKSPKTNRKYLKIPDLLALTLGRVKKITLQVMYGSYITMLMVAEGSLLVTCIGWISIVALSNNPLFTFLATVPTMGPTGILGGSFDKKSWVVSCLNIVLVLQQYLKRNNAHQLYPTISAKNNLVSRGILDYIMFC